VISFAHRSRELLLATLLVACGGHSEEHTPVVSGDSGGSGVSVAGSDWGGSAGVFGSLPGAGEGGEADEMAGAAAGAAGGHRGYVSLIESGTRRCENDDYCFGLSCYAPATFEPKVCVARCESEIECAASEACVRLEKLAPTCYAVCDSPSDCYAGFDCIDLVGEGQLVCFPSPWAVRRDDLGN